MGSPMGKQVITATILALAPDLLDRAPAVSGQPMKKAAVTVALHAIIVRREQFGLRDLV